MNANGISILIAEDSATQREQLRMILEKRGFGITVAADGAEALAQAERSAPDLILSDVVMPGLDGYQLCKRIRAHPSLKATPFILLTSLSDPEDVIKGLECGADSFISKPYEEDYLLSRIRYTLANRRVRADAPESEGVEITFAGNRHLITSDRAQILNLLMSSYETAVLRNRQLAQARDELGSLNQELDERVKELDAFAHSVSHDLRTPLRHIMGFADLLNQRIAPLLDETAGKFMENISVAARRMSALIDDLLSFSRNSRVEMLKVRVDMGALVAHVIRDLAPETAGRQLQWKIGPLPPALGDPALLELAMSNLLSNAVKYTRKRPVAVVEVLSLPGADRDTTYLVRDNGAGFDMRQAGRLFGVFQRFHAQEEFEGTGIGLANVRRIIIRHGGRIWAESAPDQGATFFFRLPSAEP